MRCFSFLSSYTPVRRPLVDARLKAIRDGEAGKILAEHDDRERPLGTWAVGVNWRKFDKEDLLEIVEVSFSKAFVA